MSARAVCNPRARAIVGGYHYHLVGVAITITTQRVLEVASLLEAEGTGICY